MIVNQIYLVTRNARDKVQVVIAELDQSANSFTILRTTGQYLGKMTKQPEITIEQGKAKRTVIQQAELEFNSIINKYMDKGYKKLSTLTTKKFEDVNEEEMNKLVPTVKSDDNGHLKPMLAKSSDKCQNSVLNKPMWCSRKLNGVRCMIKVDTDGNIITVSRGGKNYDAACRDIIKEITPFLTSNLEIILDGELYKHGHMLQELSGIARLDNWESRCEILEYHIYDIACEEAPLKFEVERLPILLKLRETFKDNPKIKVLEHVKTNSWDEIKTLHDKWVKEGYEGLVARKPDKTYEFGKRSSTMIKVKEYKDSEFTIIDYKDGLRDEDFCFICETEDGKAFAAKPVGDRELKAEYIKNIDNIIGKKGTVKYFEISKEGIPLQPIFQAIRYDL